MFQPHFGQVGFIGFKYTVDSVGVSLSGFPDILFRMKLAVLFGLGLFLLPGLFMVGIGSRNVWRGVASSHWPEATGDVAESGAQKNVEFRYRVGGQEYSTDLIQFGQTSGSSDSSEAQLRRMRYRAGSAVQVRYHPKDPSIAAVEPGFHSDSLWLPGAGLAFVLPAILFGLVALGSDGSFLGYGLAVFALIFVLIGLPMLTAGSMNLWRAYVSQQWPIAAGVILSGKPSSGNVEVEPGEEEAAGGSRLVYRYEVAGRKRYSDVRVFGQAPDSTDSEGRYPYGKKVQVAYCPTDPDLAVLEPGVTNDVYYLPGAGAAFFLFGLAAFFFGIPALRGK